MGSPVIIMLQKGNKLDKYEVQLGMIAKKVGNKGSHLQIYTSEHLIPD